MVNVMPLAKTYPIMKMNMEITVYMNMNGCHQLNLHLMALCQRNVIISLYSYKPHNRP